MGRVVEILGKRRRDLTAADAQVKRAVVDQVVAARGTEREPTAEYAGWRRSLMRIGHDPLAPSG